MIEERSILENKYWRKFRYHRGKMFLMLPTDVFVTKIFTVLNAIGVQGNGKISSVIASVGPAFAAPVFSLHEEVLVKIFSFLSLSDLLHFSSVWRWWYRLSFDCILWKDVDLKRFASRLTDPVKLELLIFKRFSTKIHCLDLSGFTVSEDSLQILGSSCKRLRVLTLKSVTFTTDAHRAIQQDNLEGGGFFPEHLECLDIRFSHGHSRVYQAICVKSQLHQTARALWRFSLCTA